jgi:hypothetical protein
MAAGVNGCGISNESSANLAMAGGNQRMYAVNGLRRNGQLIWRRRSYHGSVMASHRRGVAIGGGIGIWRI